MKRLTDNSFVRFLLVGVGNTLLSAALTLVLYNGLNVPPVLSSAIAYVAGAVMSFFLNRHFTFHSRAALVPSAVRFAVNVAVLWTLTTPLLQPWAARTLRTWMGERMANSLALLGCMGLYTVLNYFGQRFFAFRGRPDETAQ